MADEIKAEDSDQKEEKVSEETVKETSIDYKDKYFRALAELENTRKRMAKEKHDTIRYSIENAIAEFIPTIDSFEKALKCAENMSDEVKTWASGFQMFLSQFKDVLHNHGIVAFHSEGNSFDPHFHEAVETVETNDFAEGTILEEFSKGYKSANRTLKPARVKVAKSIKTEKAQEETEEESSPTEEKVTQ